LRQITEQPKCESAETCGIEQTRQQNDDRRKKRGHDHTREHESFHVHAGAASRHLIDGECRKSGPGKREQRPRKNELFKEHECDHRSQRSTIRDAEQIRLGKRVPK
jgi:hypothetical protein